ncbi:MAG: hypothetical protein KDB18_11280, partial [Salinibacterium sp.]|nr:hypothetical protein [Salinibacterium sp.]
MELIVVMAAIALLLAVAVPSFSAMIASQRRSLAQTQLQAALAGARTLALQQFRGTDTAAVFTFEPGGQITIVTCVEVGSIADVDDPSSYPAAGDPSLTIDRDVFVPDASVQPVSLPNGWMIRGLITDNDATARWYSTAPTSRSSWVFPETGFYDRQVQDDGDDRQTFMIRFEGGTGRVSADTTESLALLRRPSTLDRVTTDESALFDAEDPARFIRLRLADTSFTSYQGPATTDRAYLLGNLSSDTVL